MTYRTGDPDSTVAYLRDLEDRIKKLEAYMRTADKTATKELRLTSQRKYDSLLVVGDSISQFDRLSVLGDDSKFRNDASGGTQNRWQDLLADKLASPGTVTRYLPTVNPPENYSDYITEGTGTFRQWDYSCIGATAEWMDNAFSSGIYTAPPIPVDLFVVFLGTNDWSIDPQIASADFYTSMKSVITAHGITYRDLVLVKPWRWNRPVVGTEPWANYPQAIDALGVELSATVVELLDPALSAGNDLTVDGVHASQQGHNHIYTKIRAALSSMGTKKPATQTTLANTSAGMVIGGDSDALIIGNWKIQSRADGSLEALNILSNVSTTIA